MDVCVFGGTCTRWSIADAHTFIKKMKSRTERRLAVAHRRRKRKQKRHARQQPKNTDWLDKYIRRCFLDVHGQYSAAWNDALARIEMNRY